LGLYKKLISKRIKRINVGILGWLLQKFISIDGDMPLGQAQEFSPQRVQYVPELLLHLGPAARFSIKVDDIDLLNPRAFVRTLDTECSTLPPRQEHAKIQPESENVTGSC
jgi:hypothetical protein